MILQSCSTLRQGVTNVLNREDAIIFQASDEALFASNDQKRPSNRH